MHVSLSAEKIWSQGELIITNTLLTSWVIIALLLIASLIIGRNPKMIPGKTQNFIEYVIELVYGFFESVWADNKKAKQFFPILGTFFFFILLSNWFGLIPGVGSVGFYEHGEFVPLLRSVNSDLSSTLAWTVISVILTQIMGFVILGLRGYSKKFFNFKSPLMFFVGILELISEISKLISFSFRLFGNVFAGEVLLVVIMTLAPYILPLPFFMLELFVGFIQALVFTTLTLVFIKMATSKEGAH